MSNNYAKLVTEIFCNRYSVVSPNYLKAAIAEVNNRFSGYNQQGRPGTLSLHACIDVCLSVRL